MIFENLPIRFDANGNARLRNGAAEPYAYTTRPLEVNEPLLAEVARTNRRNIDADLDPFSRIGGSLAFHCTVDLDARRVVDTAALATMFRGYETILTGRALGEAGFVSSTASGICGGVHATASALCLEMALDLKPPPLGIVVRNLLLSCQYLNDNPMHLFILSGPDYSAATIRGSNPEIWAKAERAPAKYQAIHGYSSIGALMIDLDRPNGKLYLQALEMVRRAREAYTVLGGKYPHSESIVPGGVTIAPTLEMLTEFRRKLEPFFDYAKQCIAVWDEIFDFLYSVNPQYRLLGASPPTMVDFGQWDHEDYYDATYSNCNRWGEKRWSTPGALVNGKLVTTHLSDLNIGLEEFTDRSHYQDQGQYPFKTDPLGNPLSPYHPWNKSIKTKLSKDAWRERYSWATAPTWDRQPFEVGAYARVYLSALAKKLPASQHIQSTGRGLTLNLPKDGLAEMRAEWTVPEVWNAFERNRARAYGVAFNLMVTMENIARAGTLLDKGETQVTAPTTANTTQGQRFGAGFWGAGRGFLAHWAVIKDGVLENYQVAMPSRINACPRTPWGELGACERAVLDTPIIETNFKDTADFTAIDIIRVIQSFDPCMSCNTHTMVNGTDRVLSREVTTSYLI